MKAKIILYRALGLWLSCVFLLAACSLPGNGSGPAQNTTATACVPGQSANCPNPIAGGGAALTDTPAAGGSATPTTLPPITVIANVNDNPVYYGTCDPHFLTVKANLSGDLSSFSAVRVSWVYDTPVSSGPFGLGDVPFDHNEMTVQPDGSYLWSTDLNTAAAGWGLTGGPYAIYVYVTAWDSSWHGLGFAGPIPVRWLPCAAGSAVTPTFTHAPVVVVPTNTPVPAVVNPPTVTITSIDPSDTGYYYTGCGPNSITVRAHVTIAPGPSTVSLVYTYSTGTSGSITMGSLGGGDYQAVLPLDINTYNALHGVNGTVSFTVHANDSHGNTAAASGGPVTLMYCPG